MLGPHVFFFFSVFVFGGFCRWGNVFCFKKKKDPRSFVRRQIRWFFFFLNKTITQTKKIVLVFFLLW